MTACAATVAAVLGMIIICKTACACGRLRSIGHKQTSVHADSSCSCSGNLLIAFRWYFTTRKRRNSSRFRFHNTASQKPRAGSVLQQAPERNARYPANGRFTEASQKCLAEEKISSGNWWRLFIGSSRA